MEWGLPPCIAVNEKLVGLAPITGEGGEGEGVGEEGGEAEGGAVMSWVRLGSSVMRCFVLRPRVLPSRDLPEFAEANEVVTLDGLIDGVIVEAVADAVVETGEGLVNAIVEVALRVELALEEDREVGSVCVESPEEALGVACVERGAEAVSFAFTLSTDGFLINR